MASVVLYVHKMWLFACWRIHGQVSFIIANFIPCHRKYSQSESRKTTCTCIFDGTPNLPINALRVGFIDCVATVFSVVWYRIVV